MKAKSIKGKSTGEIKAALQDCMSDGFTPTLAVVFLSVKQNREAIVSLLDSMNITIFGATTSGEFIDGDIEEGSIVMTLFDINPAHFKLKFLETSEEATLETAKN